LQANQLAERIGALAYFETSAMSGAGVQELFDYVAEVSLKTPYHKKVSKTAAVTSYFKSRSS